MDFPAQAASHRVVTTGMARILCALLAACSWAGPVHAGGPAPEPAPLDLRGGTDLGRVDGGQLAGFSPDGRVLAVTFRGTFESVGPIRLWDLRSGKELPPVAVGWKRLETVRFSPDSRLVAAHDKKEGMGVWDAVTGKQVMAFRPRTIYENYVRFWFSPDSKALIYEHYGEKFPDDQTFNVRDIGAARDRATFTGEPWMMVVAADGQIGTGTTAPTHDKRDRVLVWAWKGKTPPVLLKEYRVRVDHLAFSPDLGSFATADGAEVRVLDMASGRERVAFTDRNPETHIQEVKFSPAGRLLIVNSGGGTQLDWKTRSTAWDISGGRARTVGEFVTEPAVSADGKFLAGTYSESDVQLVEAASGRSVGRLTQKGDVTASHFGTYNNMKVFPTVAFSPDGRLAVVRGLYAGDVVSSLARVYRLDPLKQLGVLESYSQAELAPDGRSMVAMTSGGRLRLWRIRPAKDGN